MISGFRIPGVILLFILISPGSFSQGPVNSGTSIISAEVVWVEQIPAMSGINKKKQNKRSLFSIIIGDEKNAAIELEKPVAAFLDSPEDIWILDQGKQTMIRVKNNRKEIVKAFSKNKIEFQSLVGACIIPGKEILFTDSRLNRIFTLKNDRKRIEIFGDTITLQQPTGIAYFTARSEIWVVETAAHCISVFDENGRKKRSIGKRGNGEGEFNYPTSIWIDGKGYVYIVDALNFRIQILDENGNFLKTFGEQGNATGYFGIPKSVATDSYGNIFVTDALFHVVQIFDINGRFLYSFGSQGREPGQFWMPSGIFIDKDDNIYIADSYNSRIQKFRLANIIKSQ